MRGKIVNSPNAREKFWVESGNFLNFLLVGFFGNAGKLWKLVGYGSAGRKFQPHWKKLPCQFIPFSSSTNLQCSQTTLPNYPKIVPQTALHFNSCSNLLSSIFCISK